MERRWRYSKQVYWCAMVIAKGVVGKDGFKVREREKMIPQVLFCICILHFTFCIYFILQRTSCSQAFSSRSSLVLCRTFRCLWGNSLGCIDRYQKQMCCIPDVDCTDIVLNWPLKLNMRQALEGRCYSQLHRSSSMGFTCRKSYFLLWYHLLT